MTTTHVRPIPHIFTIPELVFQILDYEPVLCPGDILSSVKTKKAHARTLLSVALSCRALSDVALSVLWRDMNGLFPLLTLVPGYAVEEGNEGCSREVRLSSNPYKPADLQRFEYYALKIRVLNLCSPLFSLGSELAAHTRLHSSELTSLPSPLLPRLQVLHYEHDWRCNSVSLLTHFLSSSLIQLSLVLPRENDILFDLRDVLSQTPSIPKVELSGHVPVNELFLDTFKDFSLMSLKIDCVYLGSGLLDTLGSFTSLRDLTLVLAGSDRGIHMMSTSICSLSLESLRITGENDEIATMLDHISPSALQVLDVEYWYSFPIGPRIDVPHHIRNTKSWMRHLGKFTCIKELNIQLSLFTDWDDYTSSDPLFITDLLDSVPEDISPRKMKLRIPRWVEMHDPNSTPDSESFWSRWKSLSMLDVAYIHGDSPCAPDPRYIPHTALESISKQSNSDMKIVVHDQYEVSSEDVMRFVADPRKAENPWISGSAALLCSIGRLLWG